MTLPRFNSLIGLQTASLVSVFLMLTGCAALQPINPDAEPVVNDPAELLITPTSEVPAPSIVESPLLETPQIESTQVEQAQVEQPQVEQPQRTSPPVSDLTTPTPNKAIAVAKKAAPSPSVSNQKPTDSVAFWLGEAGWAFEKDKLTTPKGESAYYYLSRVLAKEPRNPLALAALEKIVKRYYALLQASLNKGKVEQARVFWSRAKKVMPKHGELPTMKLLIDNHKVKQPMAVVSGPVTALPALRTQKLLLPARLLKLQDEPLASWLVAVAKKAHDLQATMLIVAPTDTQARWVYRVMNSADPEQRIRANIKHSRPARIEISYLARKDELEVYGK